MSQTLALQKGGKSSLTVPLTGEQPGNGAITIKVSNASGVSLEQVLNVPVRPAVLPVNDAARNQDRAEQQPDDQR